MSKWMHSMTTFAAAIVVCTANGSCDDKKSIDAAILLTDAQTIDANLIDANLIDAIPNGVTLTVKNYMMRCSVTVDNGNATIVATQTVIVNPGSIPVAAVATSGFELGATPWHDTVGDTGAGDPGILTGSGQTASNATVVTVGSTGACAWVCCPTSAGASCPTTNQCP